MYNFDDNNNNNNDSWDNILHRGAEIKIKHLFTHWNHFM